MKTVADRLAEFAVNLGFSDLPQEVVHEAKRRVIDSIGCALGAYSAEPVRLVRTLAREVTSRLGATLLGTEHKTGPELAAFVNGGMIRYLDFNDTYLSREPAHPSDNLSTALAMAESQSKTGSDLITALVLGYEVQCRLCDAASLRSRGWDHVTYGALSTALVAGKLLDLDQPSMVHALNLSGVANIALRQTRVGELSPWKGFAFANAARNGVFAARLASRGMTGPAPLFEGERGFFRLVTGPFEIPALGGADHPFKILETYLKFYPAEYHAQTAIEAALLLRPSCAIKDVHAIRVRTFDVAEEIIGKDPEKWHPKSRETADHSLPFLVAVALMDGQVGMEQFTERRMSDPRLLALVQKVRVVADPDFSSAYPEAMPNQVEIHATHGKRHVLKVTYPQGHPKRPLTNEELEVKFRALSSPVLSEAQQDRLLQYLWHLETAADLSELFHLCTAKKRVHG